ncbi:hypothetical protein KZX46_20855 [Polymorphobacter sp. PAMC 29334]|uniref:hypothetical protein n=1 Tax=Polymorphobacter sp. PAMC 29334 TaxID=2862331 RepID=UPI001C73FB83|nr:hypothetical protein [Polymorphobacter sp. PAMC 29334]QYE35129.1 hypothetical protein KZX46_20855 [Polymorphobacter sp. PAMC 29334]
MITITDTIQLSGLSPPLDRLVGPLLRRRAAQLTDGTVSQLCSFARFLIVEPGDSADAIDAELGFSVLQNLVDETGFGNPDFTPSWEWIEDHGGWFELVFILTDDGFAHVLFVEDREGVDADLLAACRHACGLPTP